MTRDQKISLFGAVLCHGLVLYGLQVALVTPPRMLNDTAVDVTLMAAPVGEQAPATEPTPPVETPQPPEPQPEVNPPEPPPVVTEPDPVITQPQPVPQPVAPPETAPVAPATQTSAPKTEAVVGDGSSPVPGLDRTTVQAQSGERTTVKGRRIPKPAYPPAARRNGEQGVVWLHVKVSAQGKAASVEVKESSGHPLLDEAAVKAVRRGVFDPERVGSIAVESELNVPIRFSLDD